MANTKRSLILNAVDQNSNAKQRAVTEVNPKTDRTIIAELGAKLNALTDNTLVEATSVDKTDLDIASLEKRTPTLAISGLPTTQADFNAALDDYGWRKFDISYDGDGKVYVPNYPEWPSGSYTAQTTTIIDTVITGYQPVADGNGKSFAQPHKCKCVCVNGGWQLWAHGCNDNNKFIVKATEGDTCNAVTATAALELS